MGLVTSTIDVNVKPKPVFQVAREVETYPDFMPDVKSIKILERRDDGYMKAEWVGRVQVGSIDRDIHWIEEVWWDQDSLTSHFKMVEGDYKRYKGDWTFSPVDGGTRITLNVDFDLGLPLVGPLIRKLLDKIMKENIDGMLKAIKDRAESQAGSV